MPQLAAEIEEAPAGVPLSHCVANGNTPINEGADNSAPPAGIGTARRARSTLSLSRSSSSRVPPLRRLQRRTSGLLVKPAQVGSWRQPPEAGNAEAHEESAAKPASQTAATAATAGQQTRVTVVDADFQFAPTLRRCKRKPTKRPVKEAAADETYSERTSQLWKARPAAKRQVVAVEPPTAAFEVPPVQKGCRASDSSSDSSSMDTDLGS